MATGIDTLFELGLLVLVIPFFRCLINDVQKQVVDKFMPGIADSEFRTLTDKVFEAGYSLLRLLTKR